MKTTNTFKLTIYLVLCFFLQHGFAQKASKVELPDSYDFDYVYKLKMTHKKGDAQLDYYLKEDAEYFGFDPSAMTEDNSGAKMFMVMDNKRGVNAMFMEMMGKKIVQKSNLKGSDFVSDDMASEFTFKAIGSKTILGYECEGFQGESDEAKVTVYITDDVPLSFNQIWGADKKNMPKGFHPALMEKYAESGLMMQMVYVDKKKDKNNMTMECVGLDETDFSINASAYGSMMGALGN